MNCPGNYNYGLLEATKVETSQVKSRYGISLLTTVKMITPSDITINTGKHNIFRHVIQLKSY